MKITNPASGAHPLRSSGTQDTTPTKKTQVDDLKRLDANQDGKLDRQEFSQSVRFQSADEREREALSRAFAAAASKAGMIETEDGFKALATALDETPSAEADSQAPEEQKSFIDKGLGALSSAYEAVKGFFGDVFSKMRQALSDFFNWGVGQIEKASNGFFDQFQTEVARRPEELSPTDARARLKETEADELEALSKLSSQDREAFGEVAKLLEGDPVARLRLREVLLDERLPGGNDLVNAKSLLANLSELATQPLADGIDRQELLADVLAQVDDPINIHQKRFNTCGPTTGQLVLAMQEPAEYVRLAAALASPDGETKLQNGDALARKADWNDAADDNRSVANRLFQSALMEYANGRFDYNTVRDGREIKVGPLDVAIPGLLPNEMAKLLEGLTGRKHDINLSLMSAKVSPDFLEALEAAAPGNEVPVLVNYSVDGDGMGNTSPHYLLVTGFDAESGIVSITNPWGREEKVTLDQLQRHLIASMPQA